MHAYRKHHIKTRADFFWYMSYIIIILTCEIKNIYNEDNFFVLVVVLLNFDIHNFFKENNLGISKQNITENIFKFIQPKVSVDVNVKHAVH